MCPTFKSKEITRMNLVPFRYGTCLTASYLKCLYVPRPFKLLRGFKKDVKTLSFLQYPSGSSLSSPTIKLLLPKPSATLVPVRRKSKRRKPVREDSDTEDEDEPDIDETGDEDGKKIKARVGTLRADAVLKSGLGISRSTVEKAFYESRIYLNGKKLLKKSATVDAEDEVDLVKGTSHLNPKLLNISRVTVLTVTLPKNPGEKYTVGISRLKQLLVEQYEESWKAKE